MRDTLISIYDIALRGNSPGLEIFVEITHTYTKPYIMTSFRTQTEHTHKQTSTTTSYTYVWRHIINTTRHIGIPSARTSRLRELTHVLDGRNIENEESFGVDWSFFATYTRFDNFPK